MPAERTLQALAAVRGAVYATLFVSSWAWLALLVRRWDEAIPFAVAASLRPVGMVLAAAGAVLVATCVGSFAVHGLGTPAPFDAPRRFVTVGPYRVVRNPMYLGAVAVLTGCGLVLRSAAVLALAAGFFGLAHAFVLLFEEPTLRRRFGADYEAYLDSVGRWLPRPRLAVLLAFGIVLAAALLAGLLLSTPTGVLDDSF